MLKPSKCQIHTHVSQQPSSLDGFHLRIYSICAKLKYPWLFSYHWTVPLYVAVVSVSLTGFLSPLPLPPSILTAAYLMITRVFMSAALAAGLISWLICVLALMQHKSLWLFLSAIAYTVQGLMNSLITLSPPPPSLFTFGTVQALYVSCSYTVPLKRYHSNVPRSG